MNKSINRKCKQTNKTTTLNREAERGRERGGRETREAGKRERGGGV